MSAEERLMRAHDLGISAFLGDTIYNFGELVSLRLSDVLFHPFFDCGNESCCVRHFWNDDRPFPVYTLPLALDLV